MPEEGTQRPWGSQPQRAGFRTQGFPGLGDRWAPLGTSDKAVPAAECPPTTGWLLDTSFQGLQKLPALFMLSCKEPCRAGTVVRTQLLELTKLSGVTRLLRICIRAVRFQSPRSWPRGYEALPFPGRRLVGAPLGPQKQSPQR